MFKKYKKVRLKEAGSNAKIKKKRQHQREEEVNDDNTDNVKVKERVTRKILIQTDLEDIQYKRSSEIFVLVICTCIPLSTFPEISFYTSTE